MTPKHVLTKGAVKPWHVVFMVLVAYVVGSVASDKIVKTLDPNIAWVVRDAIDMSIAAAIIIAFTIVVPEFRRVIPILFHRPRVAVRRGDVLAALVVSLSWGYGLYRAGFCLPALLFKPEWFGLLGMSEAMPHFTPKYLVIIAGITILAPLAEELVFRGFLLNLWIDRWGLGMGIVASSIFFGVMHAERTLFAAGLGFAFALVYLKYDSLWPGIVLHATYNLLAIYWLIGGFFGIKDRATVQDPANWIPEITLAVLFFPAAWVFWKRFRPRT